MAPRKQLILGANGQLGRAPGRRLPGGRRRRREELDLSTGEAVAAFDFSPYGTVINAAAYTKVDAAETDSAGARPGP